MHNASHFDLYRLECEEGGNHIYGETRKILVAEVAESEAPGLCIHMLEVIFNLLKTYFNSPP